MIIRSRRKNESLLRRLFQWSRKKPPVSAAGVCTQDALLLELAKETSRSNRQPTPREFAVVNLLCDELLRNEESMQSFVTEIYTLVRISDTLGWFEGDLALLLPETDREGAFLVANKISKMGLNLGFEIETEVQVYPHDDEITSASNSLTNSLLNGEVSAEQVLNNDGSGNSNVSFFQAIFSERYKDRGVGFASSDSQAMMTGFQASMPTPIWKRCVDVVCSSVGLLVLSPIFVVAAIAIKATTPGPIFFQQQREGKDGQQFGIWKFRTMRVDAEQLKADLRSKSEQDGPAFKLQNDPRITSVGRYLRKSCVDELPQLINVLRGQMSLVGPRPLPVDESAACEVWQRHRLRVLPGLTCIWQLEGGRDTKFNEWMRMDMDYLRRRSFLFDMKLICKTALVALLHKGSV